MSKGYKSHTQNPSYQCISLVISQVGQVARLLTRYTDSLAFGICSLHGLSRVAPLVSQVMRSSSWAIFTNLILRVGLDCAFAFDVCVFFFFFCTRLWVCDYCSCTIQWTVAANFDFSNFFSQSVHIVHCSWTHKFHFLATFSLKMGPTVLFTYLKIILLQYFLVFSFSFQFSAVFKWTLNLLQLNLTKYKEIN